MAAKGALNAPCKIYSVGFPTTPSPCVPNPSAHAEPQFITLYERADGCDGCEFGRGDGAPTASDRQRSAFAPAT